MLTQLGELLCAVREWDAAQQDGNTAWQTTMRALMIECEFRDPDASLVESYVDAVVVARKIAWAARLYSLGGPQADTPSEVAGHLTAAADLACDSVADIVRHMDIGDRSSVGGAQNLLVSTAETAKLETLARVARRRVSQAMFSAFKALSGSPDQLATLTAAYQSFTAAVDATFTRTLEDNRVFENAVESLVPAVQRLSHHEVIDCVYLMTATPSRVLHSITRAQLIDDARSQIAHLVGETHNAFDRMLLVARRYADARRARTSEYAHAATAFISIIDS
ncbi:hypothetical protein SAMN05192558_101266 [Actinokineospora alba]|uniref:Uncharacterized protein n=1 Tax=Actinokineospora alba TaxID=504798 RepID=A0A1H0F7Q7_9PSEU|nr:hypothetical protein [Actinokineospora alba]TDP69376.1 hypothetical protein C8E96_4962 [Actinokineospora alba]SDI18076.1 hypothetical protein SAMN05421871_103604 [Actinokineospora alba]SDN90708.1 hypothetical protein SAMN05192558_101266 [Actinokineospora alba]